MRTDEALVVREAALQRALGHPSRPSREEAEDIAQETVLRYGLQEPGSIVNPAAWANTVAGNLCVTSVKRGRRHTPLPDDEVEPGRALTEFLTHGKPTSYAGLIAHQSQAILAQLSPRERELIQLTVEGTPQQEIAEIMGYAGADSVKATLNRLRRKVLDAMDPSDAPDDWQDHPRPY